ncbi:MAG TPA: hypothetical protein V6C97_26025 [Oculatellaceae cyanobacterium]
MLPVIPHHAIKDVPKTVQVFQYDTSAAAGRQPLLIVPGRNDERYRYFHMQKICRYLHDDPRFQRRYKIFLFRYNTTAPEKTIESQFRVAIRELAREQGPLTVVAPSIAGNRVRNAMADPRVDQSVLKLITLGSPFHGTPLLSRDWMRNSLLSHHAWPVRLIRSAAFSVFFNRNAYLLQNYYWDNFDGQEPATETNQSGIHTQVGGSVVPPNMPPGASTEAPGHKVIAYAGYIENEQTGKVALKKKLPVLNRLVFLFGTTFPAYLGRQHPMLRYLNSEIARVPVNDQTRANYAFNDGIVPISSSLSFSLTGPMEPKLGSADSFEQIKAKVGVKRARLFPNIDHVTFMYGTGPSGRNVDLPDKLSPEEKPRPIFAWLLSDILDSADEQLTARTVADSAQ